MKEFTLKKIREEKLIAVIRANSKEEACMYSKACIEGGWNLLEITFTIPDALETLEEIKKEYGKEVLIGAGTVLDEVSARLAILKGAMFIVSPTFDKSVAKLCNLYKIPYIPGCMNPQEVKEALCYGVDVIKLFPGSAFGPSYLSALKGPFPQVEIMVTGGVHMENICEWLNKGCIAVGIGGNLVKGSFEEIVKKAQDYKKRIESEDKNA